MTLSVERLEARTLLDGDPRASCLPEVEPNDTPRAANTITVNSCTAGTVAAGNPDFFRLPVTASGRLTARVETVGVPTRLSLWNGQGQLLVQSEGGASDRLDDVLVQHLEGNPDGTPYFLEVEALGPGTGTYRLTTEWLPASPPFAPLPVVRTPTALVTGDFNGDGRLDLVAGSESSASLSLLLGLGDGTFQNQRIFSFDERLAALTRGDFNGDGYLDLAAVGVSGTVSVLLGARNEPLGMRQSVTVGGRPTVLVTGDFDGDGRLDLALAKKGSGDLDLPEVVLLLGQGDGTFQRPKRFELPRNPTRGLATSDFNGDGLLDLAVGLETGDPQGNQVAIFLGQGGGAFRSRGQVAVDKEPSVLVAGQFTDDNGDGRVDDRDAADLVVGSFPGFEVTLLRGTRTGDFRVPEKSSPLLGRPYTLAAGDFDGDGRPDLATANAVTRDVSVLRNAGNGTFQPEMRLVVEGRPYAVATGDFNGDGRLDLAVANQGSDAVVLLLGLGNGTFQNPEGFPVGVAPKAVATADFNGDGRLDLAVANNGSGDVAVLLGVGDGTFQNQKLFPVAEQPVAIVANYFNGDRNVDLVVANRQAQNLVVLLGLGDGTFQGQEPIALTKQPTALAAGDFNGDGRLDLAVGLATDDEQSDQVEIFVGLGDGKFRSRGRFTVGKNPAALVVGQFSDDNGDGRINDQDLPDLATANKESDNVSVLLGQGDGTFARQQRFPVGESPEEDLPVTEPLVAGPVSLVTGDFNRDGRPDLAVANLVSRDVVVLLGRGNGSFRKLQQPLPVGDIPQALVTGDFDGDGILDLAVAKVADRGSGDLAILRGLGNGTFQIEAQQPRVSNTPTALVTGDFDGDGILDLATADSLGADVSVLQGLGHGVFGAAGTISNPLRATPLWQDVNGDGTPDVTIVSREGEILLRLGRPGTFGALDALLTINADPRGVFDPRLAARDLAGVSTRRGLLLAALDAGRPAVSLYARQPNGTWTRTLDLEVPGVLPVRIAAADLNGDGRGDLVVVAAGSGEVFVYYQNTAGGFGPTPDRRLRVGVSPSDLALVDVDGDGRLDIVVTNQFSGDVSVLTNRRDQPFSRELRFRAGTGPYGVEQLGPDQVIRSREQTIGLAAAFVDADHLLDLVVLNGGADRFALLRGTGTGGFLNPEIPVAFTAGLRPTVVVTGLFNRDPYPDLAILNEGSRDVSIFLGDGKGGFVEKMRVPVGDAPTGLTAAQVTDDNGDKRVDAQDQIDLLVGNEFGDVLLLRNTGDGTFEPFRPASRNIALAVADLDGDGKDDFVLVNEARDRLLVQLGKGPSREILNHANGLRTPRAVGVADLNQDGLKDLVVVNSGDNSVLVFLGTGNGNFDTAHPIQRFTGTNPAAVTIKDLNKDGRDDLVVANEGSNDVTVLLGQGQGVTWTLVPGPRLRAGRGPVSTTVQDVSGPRGVRDGIPDILVSDSQSNDVSLLLLGVGSGFFDDRARSFRPVGGGPGQVFPFGPGVGTVNPPSNTVTLLPDFLQPGRVDVPSGGVRPVAALVGDFNGDSFPDLLVAHNGDGRITLLLGSANGFLLAGAFPSGFPHPTAFLQEQEGGDIFLTGEVGDGETESVSRFVLKNLIKDLFNSLSVSADPEEILAALLPLSNARLALVATLVTGSIDIESNLVLKNAAPLFSQQQADLPGDPGEGDGDAAETNAASPASASAGEVPIEFRIGREETWRWRRPLTPEELLDGSEEPGAGTGRPDASETLIQDGLLPVARAMGDPGRLLASTSLGLIQGAVRTVASALVPDGLRGDLADTLVHALSRAGVAASAAIGRLLRLQHCGGDIQPEPIQAESFAEPLPKPPEEQGGDLVSMAKEPAAVPPCERTGGGTGAFSGPSPSALVVFGLCQLPGRAPGRSALTQRRIGKKYQKRVLP